MHDSKIFGISVRAIIVIMIVATVCYMSLRIIKVEEPMYSLVFMAVGFYLGQKTSQNQPPGPKAG
jgi:hypothetical protein